MKNLFFIICIIIFPTSTLLSQKSAKKRILQDNKSPLISTRIGLNTINEANLYFEFPLNEKRNFVGSFGYNWGSKGWNSGFLFCSKSYIINESIKRKGITTRAGVRIKNPIFKRFESRVVGILSYGIAPGIEKDEGCSSGSNSSDYEKYDLTSFNLGIMHYWDIIPKNKFVTPYIGIGVITRSGRKTNYIRGSYTIASSQEDESHGSSSILIDLGLRVNIYR